MNIFGNTPQQDTDNAMNVLQQSQQAAYGALSPYTSNASQDFNAEREYLYGGFNELGQYGDVGSQFYDYANMNPIDLLNQIMGGYTLSMGARNQLKAGISGANNMATKTGMYGSGDNQMLDAEIASNIVGQDQQQYLKNVGAVTNEQQKFIQSYRQQLNGLMRAFGNMTSKEYGASTTMANIDKALGQTGANIDGREADMRNPLMNTLGHLVSIPISYEMNKHLLSSIAKV